MENFSTLTGGGFADEDLVMDGSTEIIGKLLRGMRTRNDPANDGTPADPQAIMATIEMADFEKMEQIRARAQALVDDPSTAEALKPYYRESANGRASTTNIYRRSIAPMSRLSIPTAAASNASRRAA